MALTATQWRTLWQRALGHACGWCCVDAEAVQGDGDWWWHTRHDGCLVPCEATQLRNAYEKEASKADRPDPHVQRVS